MKNKITRAELEAIGQNWLNRRNKLLALADRPLNPQIKRLKALMLADVMNNRIARVAIALAKIRPKKDFAQGGFVPSFAAGKTYPGLIALEKECANCCVVQPEWETDFKKIRQTFYSVERAENGTDILQEIRRRILSMQTSAAKRLLDKALDLQ